MRFMQTSSSDSFCCCCKFALHKWQTEKQLFLFIYLFCKMNQCKHWIESGHLLTGHDKTACKSSTGKKNPFQNEREVYMVKLNVKAVKREQQRVCAYCVDLAKISSKLSAYLSVVSFSPRLCASVTILVRFRTTQPKEMSVHSFMVFL